MSRIVQVANLVSPTSGGIRTAMCHLAQGYAENGHEVVQVVPGRVDGRTPAPWGSAVTVRAPEVPGTGYRIITRPARVERVLEDLAPDRLEVSDRTTLRGLGVWARAHGVPATVISHERLDRLAAQWLPDPVRRLLPLERAVDRSNIALARAFDAVVCTTTWAAEEFARLGTPNLHCVPLGVDLEHFRPGRSDASLREELGARGDEVLIAHVSRLSPEKRNDLAISGLRELLRRGVRARLVVAGDGSSRAAVERSATGLPVTFLGFVDDRARVAALLATADVVIAPGPVETFGLAALEALASGTPVVVHRSSALKDMVTPACGAAVAGSGWTVADGVERVLGLDAVGRRLAARRRAEDFPWSKAVEGFLRVHRLPSGTAARSGVAA